MTVLILRKQTLSVLLVINFIYKNWVFQAFTKNMPLQIWGTGFSAQICQNITAIPKWPMNETYTQKMIHERYTTISVSQYTTFTQSYLIEINVNLWIISNRLGLSSISTQYKPPQLVPSAWAFLSPPCPWSPTFFQPVTLQSYTKLGICVLSTIFPGP